MAISNACIDGDLESVRDAARWRGITAAGIGVDVSQGKRNGVQTRAAVRS